MGLKQIKDADRIIFLKEFTKHMFFSQFEDEKRKDVIEIEKLKKRFIEPINSENAFKKIIKRQTMQPSRYSKFLEEKRNQGFYKEKVPMQRNNAAIISGHINPTNIVPRIRQIEQPQLEQSPLSNPLIKTNENSLDSMKKIEPLLRDASILSIECSGPGKNLIVKRFNQINVTQVTLSQKDINSIIEYYSKEARIPLLGGILKAAVGNSIISAVTSEFVGSRFIINKITPYSMIHK
jgi:hypothetical protein